MGKDETRPEENRPDEGAGRRLERSRRRDRHGRGIRGPLAPRQSPLSSSRAERFDDLVLDAVERLELRLPEIAEMDIVVAEVPPDPGAPGPVTGPRDIPLGHSVPAGKGRPARVVIHRRPIEMRATSSAERAGLVADVVAEQVAELLGMRPDDVDPGYPG